MPEYLITIIFTAIIGWGGFTWRRAEDAIVIAMRASSKIDRVEVKTAENYLSKQEFESYMDRLMETLSEMKKDMHYLTERVDKHLTSTRPPRFF